ncbi:UNVERIFIED_CONTAM: hypothetical protein Scaly_2230200 [Sesamum calycinum]|uniref:Uncharacterized protein n=1 Tax=Sesamum calycinum TaxID=2727403 RepID=A0AAW2M9W5_9LAMI
MGKSHWLKEGDRNTGFFHAYANKIFNRNQIKRIKNSEGRWLDKKQDIAQYISNYFGRIFRSTELSLNDLDRGVEALSCKVDLDMNLELLKPHTPEEIIAAVTHMAP